eukprot:scaffold93395_cov40-Tisochrysis_lutea.AAC.1
MAAAAAAASSPPSALPTLRRRESLGAEQRFVSHDTGPAQPPRNVRVEGHATLEQTERDWQQRLEKPLHTLAECEAAILGAIDAMEWSFVTVGGGREQ